MSDLIVGILFVVGVILLAVVCCVLVELLSGLVIWVLTLPAKVLGACALGVVAVALIIYSAVLLTTVPPQ